MKIFHQLANYPISQIIVHLNPLIVIRFPATTDMASLKVELQQQGFSLSESKLENEIQWEIGGNKNVINDFLLSKKCISEVLHNFIRTHIENLAPVVDLFDSLIKETRDRMSRWRHFYEVVQKLLIAKKQSAEENQQSVEAIMACATELEDYRQFTIFNRLTLECLSFFPSLESRMPEEDHMLFVLRFLFFIAASFRAAQLNILAELSKVLSAEEWQEFCADENVRQVLDSFKEGIFSKQSTQLLCNLSLPKFSEKLMLFNSLQDLNQDLKAQRFDDSFKENLEFFLIFAQKPAKGQISGAIEDEVDISGMILAYINRFFMRAFNVKPLLGALDSMDSEGRNIFWEHLLASDFQSCAEQVGKYGLSCDPVGNFSDRQTFIFVRALLKFEQGNNDIWEEMCLTFDKILLTVFRQTIIGAKINGIQQQMPQVFSDAYLEQIQQAVEFQLAYPSLQPTSLGLIRMTYDICRISAQLSVRIFAEDAAFQAFNDFFGSADIQGRQACKRLLRREPSYPPKEVVGRNLRPHEAWNGRLTPLPMDPLATPSGWSLKNRRLAIEIVNTMVTNVIEGKKI